MTSPKVQLNDIALFVEVAKRKSFSAAAEALDVPTSTLSRRVSRLEQAIGMRLINRNTRRLDLTAAGQIYFERCQNLVTEARLAHEHLLAVQIRPHGRLNVSMPYGLATILLPESMREFTDSYPDLECEFDVGSSTPDAYSKSFDIMLSLDGPRDPSKAFSAKLVDVPMHLYASGRYLETHGTPQTPADLSKHQCIRTAIDDRHSWWMLERDGELQRIAAKGNFGASTASLSAIFAGLHLGVACLPTCVAMEETFTRHDLHRVLPEWSSVPMSVYAVFPSHILPAKTRVFMEFLKPQLSLLKVSEVVA